MTLIQRALFLVAAFGISCSQDAASNSHPNGLATSIGTLVDGLQNRNNRLLASIHSVVEILAGVRDENQALDELTVAVNAAVPQLKGMVNASAEEIISYLRTMSSTVESISSTLESLNNRPTPPPPPPMWSSTQIGFAPLRLVGSSRTEGRMEVFYDGEWGTVCDDYFTNATAAVICRSMGLPSRKARYSTLAEHGSGPIHLDDVNCIGTYDARACHHIGWGQHDCTHSEDIGLICVN